MIKISAMTVYAGPLDDVYVPIIRPTEGGDNPWANFRMLVSDLQGEPGEPGEAGSVTAENGITKTLYDVVKLGGPLTEATEIDVNGHTLSVTNLTENTTPHVLYINETTGEITYGDAPTATILADNGVTVSGGTTAQLGSATAGGSTFTVNRFIDALAKYLSITGTVNDGQGVVRIANSGSGYGLTVTSTTSDAIQATSSSGGSGVTANSTTGAAFSGSSSSGGKGFDVASDHSSTNTVRAIGSLTRSSSGTPAAGMGGSLDYFLERASGGGIISGRIANVWTDPALATYTSRFEFSTALNAAFVKQFTIYGNGDIEVHTVGKGIIIPSPDGTRYRLQPANGGGSSTWTAV